MKNKVIETLSKSGQIFSDYLNSVENNETNILKQTIEQISIANNWFTKENIHFSLQGWAQNLTHEKLSTWLSSYEINPNEKKRVAVIMAGNIPLVGLHDLICVLLSGNIFIGKLSSKDDKLMKVVVSLIKKITPELGDSIFFEDQILKNFDAVIATGSNNTARYFEYYFGKYPNIIRKNRNSVAILRQSDKNEDIKKLADDIFVYFGLGCRNVSKLYVPYNFDFTNFFEQIEHYAYIKNHNKYANNYDYNKAIFLVNQTPFTDNGFVLLKEDTQIASPTSVLYYEFYENIADVEEKILAAKENIQCVVCNSQFSDKISVVPFGKAQIPELSDYADNIDTLQFLINL